MILLDLLAATTTAPTDNRSWADWGYDVSKNVVSAAGVAFVIAVVGKGIGWNLFTWLRWWLLAGILASASVLGLEVWWVLESNRDAAQIGLAIFGGLAFAFLVYMSWVYSRKWPPPPDVSVSYLDSVHYEAPIPRGPSGGGGF